MLNFHRAYVLHTRDYRDTSKLVAFFTEDAGKITCVARAVKQEKSPLKGILQPFQPLQIQYKGKTELKSLYSAENIALPHRFRGIQLYSALYLNELLYRLLQTEEPHERIFSLYQTTLQTLPEQGEQALRAFEYDLLHELGFALTLNREVCNNSPIDPEAYYCFHPAEGLTWVNLPTTQSYLGEDLLAMAQKDFSAQSVRFQAKKLFSEAIQYAMAHRPLMSRKIFSRRY